MTKILNRNKIWILISVGFVCGLITILFSGCTGRTADNMKPLGETVRVVIPTPDVAEDSAIAAGDVQPVSETPDSSETL